jgi:hypothetical protein
LVDASPSEHASGRHSPTISMLANCLTTSRYPGSKTLIIAPQPQRPGKRGRDRRKTSHPDEVIYFWSNEQDFQETPSCQL